MPKTFKLKKHEEKVIENYNKYIDNLKNREAEDEYFYSLGRLGFSLRNYLYWKFDKYRNIISFPDYYLKKEILTLQFYISYKQGNGDPYKSVNIGAINITVNNNKIQYELNYFYNAELPKSSFRYNNYTSLAKTLEKFLKKIKEGEYKYE